MARIFGIIFLILSVVLFPPATLALISNNAVPGEATYPIKRKLEDGILLIASLNPTTKAWFSVERSNRRFQEVSALLGQGKGATETIDELVFQTQGAVDEIAKINDNAQKDQLINQLSKSIEKYDKGLAEASGVVTPPSPSLVPQAPAPTPTPVPTSQPVTPPVTKPSLLTPTVAPTLAPTAPPVVSAPVQTGPTEKQKEELERAREELEKIKERLEREKKKLQEERKEEREHREESRQERKEDRKERTGKKDD